MNTKLFDGGLSCFWLVETHAAPSATWPTPPHDAPHIDGQQLKMELKKDEPFETEFIGASVEDCRKWAMEMQYRVNYIEQDHIAILDERGIRDGTVLMSCYVHAPGLVLGEEGEDGIFPKEADRWYDFRIELRHVPRFTASFSIGVLQACPVYFGRKEDLTDANGVFDVEKAEKITVSEEGNPSFDRTFITSDRPV